jgi:amino acid transporter
VVGFFAPFATGCFAWLATHLAKFGGSGTVTFEPGAAEPFAAAFSQWLNWSLVMTVSPILATPLVGTSFPQPAMRAAQAAMGSAMRRMRGIGKRRGRGENSGPGV